MPNSAPPPSDRRSGDRHLACFPASVRSPDGTERAALIHDLSVAGGLLFVRTKKLGVGDPVTLDLFIAKETDTFRRVLAKVVRVEPIDEPGAWLCRVAVQFDEPITMYVDEVVRFRERVNELGLDKRD
jgi:hypothetical protein